MRQHWPTLLLAAVVVLAYVDLKRELKRRPAPEPTSPPAVSGPLAPPAGFPTPVSRDVAPDVDQTSRPVPEAVRLVTRGTATGNCTGSIADADIQRAIEKYIPDARECQRAHAPRASGSLELRLEVNARGRVVAGEARGPLRTERMLVHCIGTATDGWRFPELDSGTCAIISLPLKLTKLAPLRVQSNHSEQPQIDDRDRAR